MPVITDGPGVLPYAKDCERSECTSRKELPRASSGAPTLTGVIKFDIDARRAIGL